MSIRKLDGLYDQLQPGERFRLTLAALGRGDEDEVQRLETTCPRKNYSMADAAVADLVDASREAAMFFTVLFQHVLRFVDGAWHRLEVGRAYINGYSYGAEVILDLTVGPSSESDDMEQTEGGADEWPAWFDGGSRPREQSLRGLLEDEYHWWVAALGSLQTGFARFCAEADLHVDEVLAWSPLGMEALEQANIHLSKNIPADEALAEETTRAFHDYWPELQRQMPEAVT
jgi:hypothetical protein